jgi:hypothetical protein
MTLMMTFTFRLESLIFMIKKRSSDTICYEFNLIIYCSLLILSQLLLITESIDEDWPETELQSVTLFCRRKFLVFIGSVLIS